MLKGKPKPEPDAAGNEGTQQPQFKENAQVNARIDEYITNNPKQWTFIQSMTPERMARALVLNQIQKEDRTQKMQAGIMRKLDENPEMKQSIQTMVKNLPEDQQEKIMANIAMRTQRTVSRGQEQAAARPAQKV